MNQFKYLIIKSFFTKRNFFSLAFILILAGGFYFFYYRRDFYCHNGNCITVWKPLGEASYIIEGKYFGLRKPRENYQKLYSSKFIYLCKNDEDKLGIAVGSATIESQPFNKTNFYSIFEFFLKFRGEEYRDGELIKTPDSSEKKAKYSIYYIEL